MVGTCLAGQRPGPAEPAVGTARQRDIRVEGRSLSGLRPDSLFRCSALDRLLTLPQSVPAAGEAGQGAGQQHAPALHLSARQQTSMPSGSGLLPGPVSRALRAWRDHWGWVWLDHSQSLAMCLVQLSAPRSTVDSRLLFSQR